MLRGIIWRRAEIKPAALFVGGAKIDQVEIPVRNQLHAASVARNKIRVWPAVPFCEPEKIGDVMKPGDFRNHAAPGAVVVLKNRASRAAGAIGEQNIVRVLQTI